MPLSKRLQSIQQKSHSDINISDILYGFKSIRENIKSKRTGYTQDIELEHLKRALQGAITLEFATLPPYLSAIWSIKDDLSPVAKSIREIVQEEMLHMVLACNMLVAIGGQPKINTAVPIYPGNLPLKVHPELTVQLSGLTDDALAIFMEIERPQHPGYHIELNSAKKIQEDSLELDEHEQTIGEFYDQILKSFKRLKPTLSTDRQVTGPLAWMVVNSIEDVEKAIMIIKDQGEGSEGPADTGADDLAHYYRFAELKEGKRLVYNEETEEYSFTTPITFNLETDVWPMTTVPEGGYTDSFVSDLEVRRLLRSFNLTFSKLVDLLQSIWEPEGGEASLWRGIDTMFELEKYAIPLMQIPRLDGKGNFGPDFRYIPRDQR